jgi:hypothetical protein
MAAEAVPVFDQARVVQLPVEFAVNVVCAKEDESPNKIKKNKENPLRIKPPLIEK